jgi:NitT/TauT family transport system substrate-binding protein
VKVGTSTSVGSTGFFIGLERGYYREVGLDVEIVPFEGATEMIAPLASSQIDVTNADAGTTVFNALGRDLPLHFVAEGNRTTPGHSNLAWVIRKDLADSGALRDLADLRGKRISPRARGSLVDMLAHRTLALAGLGPDDVDLQYILSPNVMPAFANGALDAAILGEPLVGAAADQGLGVRWRGMDELFGSFQNTLVMYSPTMTTQRQDVGRRFMAAYVRALRDHIDAFATGKDQDAVIAILTKHTAIRDPAVYKKMVLPDFDPNGQMDLQSIREQMDWYVANGFIPNPVALERFVDTSYLDYALGVVGRRGT